VISTTRTTALLFLAVSLLCTGCIKIRLTVQLNEDGSGQVVEDIVFGEKLVDASKRIKGVPTIDELTSADRIKKRLSQMGKGVSLAGKKVEKQPDGSVRMVVTYAFEDISELKLAPFPYGPGWEDAHLAFTLRAETNLEASYQLQIQFKGRSKDKSEPPPLNELGAQQIRQLLPIFKDMLEGFELKLRLEVYAKEKWATVTKGHMPGGGGGLGVAGGRLTIYQITDKHLRASEDGLMLIAPWRQVGREVDFYNHYNAPGLRLLPHVNLIDRGAFSFGWRAIQTPRGREYY
jgi:hypothetical protein